MDTIDKAAMYVSTGLMFLGIVVLGLVELLDGTPHGAVPVTNDAGEIVARPLIDPTLRTGLVVAGLVVLALYAVYRLARPAAEQDEAETRETAA